MPNYPRIADPSWSELHPELDDPFTRRYARPQPAMSMAQTRVAQRQEDANDQPPKPTLATAPDALTPRFGDTETRRREQAAQDYTDNRSDQSEEDRQTQLRQMTHQVPVIERDPATGQERPQLDSQGRVAYQAPPVTPNPAIAAAVQDDAFAPRRVVTPTLATDPRLQRQQHVAASAMQSAEDKRAAGVARGLKAQGVEMVTELDGSVHPKKDEQGRTIYKPAVLSQFEDRGQGNLVSVHRDRFGNEQDVPLKPKIDKETGEKYVVSADGVSRMSLGIDQDFVLRRDAAESGKIAAQSRGELAAIKAQQTDLKQQVEDYGGKAAMLAAKKNPTPEDVAALSQIRIDRAGAVKQLDQLKEMHAAKSEETIGATQDYLDKRKLIIDKLKAKQTPPTFDTKLDPSQESQFQYWKKNLGIKDDGSDYDYRGAFKAGVTPDASLHWPDTFKKPNHPTFSEDSMYAKQAPDKAGTWDDKGNFVPPPGQMMTNEAASKALAGDPAAEKQLGSDPNYAAFKSGLLERVRSNEITSEEAGKLNEDHLRELSKTAPARLMPPAKQAEVSATDPKTAASAIREEISAAHATGNKDALDYGVAAIRFPSGGYTSSSGAYVTNHDIAQKIKGFFYPLFGPNEEQQQHVYNSIMKDGVAEHGLLPSLSNYVSTAASIPSTVRGLVLMSQGKEVTPQSLDDYKRQERQAVGLARDPSDSKPWAVTKGVANSLLNAAEAFINPAFFSLPSSRVLSGVFGAQLASGVPEAIQRIKSEPTLQGKVEAATDAAVDVLAAGFAARHAMDSSAMGAASRQTWQGSKETADLVQEAIKTAKANGVSPEFRSFFGGIDPELAGTTPEKVAEFAKSMGMEWKPSPKPASDESLGDTSSGGAPTPTQPTAPQGPLSDADVTATIDQLRGDAKTHAQDLAGEIAMHQAHIEDPMTPAADKAERIQKVADLERELSAVEALHPAQTQQETTNEPAGFQEPTAQRTDTQVPATEPGGQPSDRPVPDTGEAEVQDQPRQEQVPEPIQGQRDVAETSGGQRDSLATDEGRRLLETEPALAKTATKLLGLQYGGVHDGDHHTFTDPKTGSSVTVPFGTTPKELAIKVDAARKNMESPRTKEISDYLANKDPMKQADEGGISASAAVAMATKLVGKDEMVKRTGTGTSLDWDATNGRMVEAARQILAEHQKSTVVDFSQPATVDASAHEAATSPQNALPTPSLAQHEADNAKLGHDSIGGMPISFENPAGSIRTNVDMARVRSMAGLANEKGEGSSVAASRQLLKLHEQGDAPGVAGIARMLKQKHSEIAKGRPWASKMRAHYGRFKGTTGKDGEHLDAYVKAGTPKDFKGTVYIVNQKKQDGGFDETKSLVGYANQSEAVSEYAKHYDIPAAKLIHSVAAMPWEQFKTWAREGDHSKPVTNQVVVAKEAGPAQAAERKLPKDLAGAKPRYAYGSKQFELSFESDADRAAYIAAQDNKSKADARYMAFAQSALQMSPDEVIHHGKTVRAKIKEMAKDAEPGTLTVPKVQLEIPQTELRGGPEIPGRAKRFLIEAMSRGKARATLNALGVEINDNPGHASAFVARYEESNFKLHYVLDVNTSRVDQLTAGHNDDYAREVVQKSLSEELIHFAQFEAVRKEWQARQEHEAVTEPISFASAMRAEYESVERAMTDFERVAVQEAYQTRELKGAELGAEFVRQLIQTGREGTPTEAVIRAKSIIERILAVLKRLLDNAASWSEALKRAYDRTSAVLDSIEKATETKADATPATEPKPAPSAPTQGQVAEAEATEAGPQASGASDELKQQAKKAFEGLFAPEPDRPDIIDPDDPLAKRLRPIANAMLGGPEIEAQKLFDQGAAIYSVLNDGDAAIRIKGHEDFRTHDVDELYELRAPEPDAQEPLPKDRRAAFFELADRMEAEGITTPDAVATFLDEMGARKYSDAIVELIAERAATTATEVEGIKTVEVPLSQITLSTDVPQFKSGADVKGIVEPIAGKYERTGTPPVQLWERLDGKTELISGRHRFDLAQRTGETTIPAQIHREAAGFTQADAAKLDAELNIRDEQGSTADYANYFRNARVTEADAESRGLLARAKGKAGFSIARDGSEDLFALHQSGRISDGQATAIASAAPGNAGAQQIGIRAALEGKSAEYVGNLIKAATSRTAAGPQTGDLFAFDDSAMREMEGQAKRASEIQGELRKTKAAITGASKDPERAKAEGVDVKKPKQVAKRVAELNAELARWDNWPMHADLVAQTKGEPVSNKTTEKNSEIIQPPSTETPPETTTQFGDETLSQQEMFGIEKITELKDPAKSAMAAARIHGSPAAAVKAIQRQLRVIDSQPATKKAFAKEQRDRLREVVALLQQKARLPEMALASSEPSRRKDNINELQQHLEQTNSGRDERPVSQKRIDQQAESLLRWAEDTGNILPKDAFRSTVTSDNRLGGGEEHEVWLDPKTGRVVKITLGGVGWGIQKDLARYLDGIEAANAEFGDDIQFEGVTEIDGFPRIIISQPFYKGEMATEVQIDAYFGRKGFLKIRQFTYRRGDVIVADAKPKNVFRAPDGTIRPFDVIVDRPSRATGLRASEPNDAEKKEIDTAEEALKALGGVKELRKRLDNAVRAARASGLAIKAESLVTRVLGGKFEPEAETAPATVEPVTPAAENAPVTETATPTRGALVSAFKNLPATEQKVLAGRMNGKTNAELAAELKLSEHGVETAYQIALKKLTREREMVAAKFEQVKAEKVGERTQGRPELANPAQGPMSRRMVDTVDQLRKEAGVPGTRKDTELAAEAASRLDKDYQGERRTLMKRASQGGMFDDVETLMAKRIVAREALGAVKGNNQAKMLAAAKLIDAYRMTGTTQARAMRQRQDFTMSPEDRAAEYLSQALLTPDKPRRNRMEDMEEPGQREEALREWMGEIARIKKALAKLGIDFDAMSEDEIREALKDRSKAVRAVRAVATAKADKWDALYEYWISAILSAPPTQIANIIGNSINALWDFTAQRLAEAVVNLAVRDPGSAQFAEFKYIARGILPGLARAGRNFVTAWQTEAPVFEEEVTGEPGHAKIESQVGHHAAIAGTTGRVIRTPLRLLLAADEFSKSLVGTMQVQAEALRIAMAEKLTGDAMAKRMAELTDTLGSPAWQAAAGKATDLAFQKELGSMGKAVIKFRDNVAGTRYIVPFVVTMSNIFKVGVRKTPLGSISLVYNLGRQGMVRMGFDKSGWQYTRKDFVPGMAEQLLAWGLYFAIMGMTEPDDKDGLPRWTGTTPYQGTKKGERDLAYRTAPPMSVRIGSEWYSYTRIEPVATALALMIDMQNTLRQAKNGKDYTAAFGSLFTHMVEQVKDKTFARGVGDILNAIQDGQHFTEWVGNFATSWVPNLVKVAARESDPYIREQKAWGRGEDWTGNFLDALKYKALPLANEVIQPKIDLWGRPIEKDKGISPATDWLFRMVTPMRTQPTDKVLEVDRAITNWNNAHPNETFAPQPPAPYWEKKIDGKMQTFYMTRQEYRDFLEQGGTDARGRVEVLGIDPDAPTEKDMKAISEALKKAHKETKERLWEQRLARQAAA